MDRESGLAATSASASASACACAGLFLDGWTAGRGLPFSPHPPHPPRPPTYYSSSTATLRCPPSTHARRDSITKHQANAVALFFLLSLRLPSSEATLYVIHSYSIYRYTCMYVQLSLSLFFLEVPNARISFSFSCFRDPVQTHTFDF